MGIIYSFIDKDSMIKRAIEDMGFRDELRINILTEENVQLFITAAEKIQQGSLICRREDEQTELNTILPPLFAITHLRIDEKAEYYERVRDILLEPYHYDRNKAPVIPLALLIRLAKHLKPS